ncbi:hypothetical protein C1I98_07845 [Spongiactinospora gelatinilytica]|uniref:Uncharacterized protein n=1 Tax=Spongiactinospora gelatinilytica TaxID=2666298 RepID=A0A2W2HNF3_9ACTN|nr:hypothetical protein [Spongiactinospora gelatinilytica]PZG51970.1 hypothetical protein C1I98_07845 [Spongiactinospora gelatinilytica]
MNGDLSRVEAEPDGERHLRITLELTVEVLDVDALQAAALAELRDPDHGFDESQRQEQSAAVTGDESGASALQWLIQPDHVRALIEHIDEVEPRDAVLSVTLAEDLDEDEEEEEDQ